MAPQEQVGRDERDLRLDNGCQMETRVVNFVGKSQYNKLLISNKLQIAYESLQVIQHFCSTAGRLYLFGFAPVRNPVRLLVASLDAKKSAQEHIRRRRLSSRSDRA